MRRLGIISYFVLRPKVNENENDPGLTEPPLARSDSLERPVELADLEGGGIR